MQTDEILTILDHAKNESWREEPFEYFSDNHRLYFDTTYNKKDGPTIHYGSTIT